ncbi:hypothetical protein P691DRAFT_289927 [Macrolepiota fuliginosa MF-IS2]|uniref:Secreted protein n=1 Tax=Macrolepiota fuliginosa MF-IS2 TaxID=1400762 RepID=A0A9P5X7K4_9AGAR|nr:hypothetical protein P691DRAFT_289927 [Macrolepiota fuliginosa MF-IS2]
MSALLHSRFSCFLRLVHGLRADLHLSRVLGFYPMVDCSTFHQRLRTTYVLTPTHGSWNDIAPTHTLVQPMTSCYFASLCPKIRIPTCQIMFLLRFCSWMAPIRETSRFIRIRGKIGLPCLRSTHACTAIVDLDSCIIAILLNSR